MIKKISKKAILIVTLITLLLNIATPIFATINVGDTSHLYGEKELPRFVRN